MLTAKILRFAAAMLIPAVLAACGGASGSASSPGTANETATTEVIAFSTASYSTTQSAGSVVLTVARSGTMAAAASVDYSSGDGTAIANADYAPVSGTLHWAANESASKTISVAVRNSTPFSGSKAFQVVLSNPSATAVTGTPSTAAVTISGTGVVTDPTPTPPAGSAGNLQLSASSYSITQGAGSLTISVQRTGGSVGAVNVSYATSNGSAMAGTDYTAASGTLQWASGDGATKTFSIEVSNSTPFTGSKNLTVNLSNATGGAQVGTPSSAGVTINGSGSSGGSGGGTTGSGTAPTALTVTGQSANAISLSWTGVTGAKSYKIYRNGSSYATSTSTNYTDSQAFTATVPTYDGPAKLYTYAVSAIDSSGNESAQTTDTTYWVYYQGVFNWEGDYSYGATINYSDTAGAPQSAQYDMGVTVTSAGSGIQPYAGKTVPTYDLELGAYNYMQLDIKPTLANQTFTMSMMSRLPPGDVFPSVSAKVQDYGPAMTAGKWATYKIPLSVFHLGKTGFVGSISGSTLTVTSASQSVIDAGGFITGPGVTPGTYVTAVGNGTTGAAGTYTVVPAQNVSSANMTYQRTHLYKFDLMDHQGASSNKYYVDNIRFTVK